MEIVKKYARYWQQEKLPVWTRERHIKNLTNVGSSVDFHMPDPGPEQSPHLLMADALLQAMAEGKKLNTATEENDQLYPDLQHWLNLLPPLEQAMLQGIPDFITDLKKAITLAKNIREYFCETEKALLAQLENQKWQEHAQKFITLERLNGLFQTSYDAVFITDEHFKIIKWNPSAEQLWGYKLDEVLGKNCFMLFPHSCVMKVENMLKQLGSHSGTACLYMSDLNIRTQRKRSIPADLSCSAWQTHQGWCYGFIARDVSERRKTERELKTKARELESSNAELEQFAYVASHDLKEPLRMVSNYTMLLKQKYADQLDEQAHEYIGFAVEGVLRMSDLIQDLLNYSRLNTDTERWGPVDLNTVASLVQHDFADAIQERQAQITTEALPTIIGDRMQMMQLYQNLISNALKFSADKPVIRLGASREDNYYKLYVRDNGIGFRAEYAEKVFQMFQRLNSRDEYPGTGIGLAICKKIIDRHGGRIWSESQPDKGSTFYFTLPVFEKNQGSV